MFNQAANVLKIKKLESEMKKIQAQVFQEESKGSVTVLVRGDNRIEKITIDGEERKDIKDLLNSALKTVEKKAQKKARSMASEFAALLG